MKSHGQQHLNATLQHHRLHAHNLLIRLHSVQGNLEAGPGCPAGCRLRQAGSAAAAPAAAPPPPHQAPSQAEEKLRTVDENVIVRGCSQMLAGGVRCKSRAYKRICQWQSDHLLHHTRGLKLLWTCRAYRQHASPLHLPQQALNPGTSKMLHPVSVHVAGGQLHACIGQCCHRHGRLGATSALRLEVPARMPGTACILTSGTKRLH